MIIYKTTNLINGKEYVGLDTKDRGELEYLGSGSVFLKAVKKYGNVNFKKRILCVCNNYEDLCLAEELYIELYNTYKGRGYNLTKGGKGSCGYSHTEETKNKMSKIMTGKKQSQETISKKSKSQKGKKRTQVHKKKMSDAQKGRKVSEEHRKKISEAKKGKPSHRKGVSMDEEHGIEKAKEIKKKQSEKKKGNNHHMYRKHLSEKTKQKISKANTGKKASKETRQKLSDSHKGKISLQKGRTYEEIHGVEKAKELKKKQSESAKKRKHRKREYKNITEEK